MSIEILPAQLANQIAAGEVVERPASVVKELVENSIDSGATTIKIHIEKGGAKRIKISDNGSGIAKDELSLALSRHATSKIKNLNDLEGISSLGFRGEALASISSVSRLTLTSKPSDQESAWQASAEGRDMAVDIKPAAHPTGTTIDVQDLFFNTPARRKFLRTDKTEFTHIEEVIKRIALACLDITIVLIHNDKLVKQYRSAQTKAQCSKRVAQICGQKFIENSIEVECQHDDLHFSGWLAKPSFSRNQNDLCYSYVNGRMMRDKLINHAIRQAYSDLLPPDTYPAFVLFLTLNHRDVDVNVHPAKHEVRFHQGRYIHDFIFSVCQKALNDDMQSSFITDNENMHSSNDENNHYNKPHQQTVINQQEEQSYIKPLTPIEQPNSVHYSPLYSSNNSSRPSAKEQNAYYQLMTNSEKLSDVDIDKPSSVSDGLHTSKESSKLKMNDVLVNESTTLSILHIIQSQYALILLNEELRLLSLEKLDADILRYELAAKWQAGFISQPLLLPVKIELDNEKCTFIEKNHTYLERLGIVVHVINKKFIQIRQFAALLRNKDVTSSFLVILEKVFEHHKANTLSEELWLISFIFLLKKETYTVECANKLFSRLESLQIDGIDQKLLLNSTTIDLTSEISHLM